MTSILTKPISGFMTKKVIAVSADEDLKHLFQLMERHGILGVPVVDKSQRVVGMVTESDLIRHFTTLEPPQGVTLLGSVVYLEDLDDFNQKLKDHCAEQVKGLMTSPVVTIASDATLQEALNLMSERKINRLPVVDPAGKLTGIVTRTDILHELAKLPNP